MKKRKHSPLFGCGAVLIAASLLLAAGWWLRTYLGTQNSKAVVAQMEELLPERTLGVPEGYLNSMMPVLELDGEDYVALLEVPAYGISLPVADRWDSDALADAPARFCGSAYDGTLVIGGLDHGEQFAFCGEIDMGARLTVTDMTGACFTYVVERVDRADHAEAAWLQNAEFDLTLFCRNAYSSEYIAVRCVFSYGA